MSEVTTKRIVHTNPKGWESKKYFPESVFQGVLRPIPSNQDGCPYSFTLLENLIKCFPYMEGAEVVEIENNQDSKYRL